MHSFLKMLISTTLVVFFTNTGIASAGEAKPMDVEKAISVMRDIDVSKMKEEELKAKEGEMEQAWEALIAAGQEGVKRIKQELKAIEKSGKKDDRFALAAAAVLWQISKLDEAGTIANIWESTSLETNYNYVFFTALEAAVSRDERAVPMLLACLRNKKGQVFIVQHYQEFYWPDTVVILWAVYGSKGLPALAEKLKSTTDSVTKQSAMRALAVSQYLPALETIRVLAKDKDADVRDNAFQCLGTFGHPSDFDVITAGLKDSSPMAAAGAAIGLALFDDLRAVPFLVPIAESKDGELRRAALMALAQLPSPASLDVLLKHAEVATDKEEKEGCDVLSERVLSGLDVDKAVYAKKSDAGKQDLFKKYLKNLEDKYVRKPDDKQLTHDELLEAAVDWISRGRITGGPFEWVEDRHVLAAASDKDLGLLLDVKGKVVLRLSDECLSEIKILDDIMKRLGRARYRQEYMTPPKPQAQQGNANDARTVRVIWDNEKAIVEALQDNYLLAQGKYHRIDHDKDGSKEYASDLDDLYDFDGPGGEPPLALISLDMAKADVELGGGTGDKKANGYGGESQPYKGYYFCDMIGSKNKDGISNYRIVDGDKPPVGYRNDFSIVAFPAEFGKTGRRCFIINDEGTSYGKLITDKDGKFNQSMVPKYWPQDEIDNGLWEMIEDEEIKVDEEDLSIP